LNTQQAYNNWSSQYDSNQNKTRDLEAEALQSALNGLTINRHLELGCGTGKNSAWLSKKAIDLTAVDFSEGMLAVARKKVTAANTRFVQADLHRDWNFTSGLYDCISFSLVLEHFDDLRPLFKKTATVLQPGGYVYAGELHPFKQYSGSKARFDTEAGTQVVECYDHHVSDFTNAARATGLQLISLDEYFDGDDRKTIPRILAILFRKDA